MSFPKTWQARYTSFSRALDMFCRLGFGCLVIARIDSFVPNKRVIGWILALTALFLPFVVEIVLKVCANAERFKLDGQARSKREELKRLQTQQQALVDQIQELWFDPWAQVADVTILHSPEGEISVQAVVLRFNDDDIRQPGKLVLVFDPLEGFVRSLECHFVDGGTWISAGNLDDRIWEVKFRLLSWVEGKLLRQHWHELAQVVESD